MTLDRSCWHVEHLRHFIHLSVLEIKQSHNLLLSVGKPPNELLYFKPRSGVNRGCGHFVAAIERG